jgi:hypothetical protein
MIPQNPLYATYVLIIYPSPEPTFAIMMPGNKMEADSRFSFTTSQKSQNGEHL